MSTPQPKPAAIPPEWFAHEFTLIEMAKIAGVQPETAYSWVRWARAMGFVFGEKRRSKWWFSGHEIYTICLISNLSAIGFPIGMTQIRSALEFVSEERGPTGSFVTGSPNGLAAVFVSARDVFDSVVRVVGRSLAVIDEAYKDGLDYENRA